MQRVREFNKRSICTCTNHNKKTSSNQSYKRCHQLFLLPFVVVLLIGSFFCSATKTKNCIMRSRGAFNTIPVLHSSWSFSTKNAAVRLSVHSTALFSSSVNPSNYIPNNLTISTKDRPFTLPAGQFRPKQSLGQNYLSDQNYVVKIVNTFVEAKSRLPIYQPPSANNRELESDSIEIDGILRNNKDNNEKLGSRVVEIGPGMGALTRVLVRTFPHMTAVELDQRAILFLKEKLPALNPENIKHLDVLKMDWPLHAAQKGGKLSIIANLPYYITSQVLFSLADSYRAIDIAVVTMQLEVAERICAAHNTKSYGIPSVVFQLYGQPTFNFKIPPKVFFPVPKVDSALITIDFNQPHPLLHTVNPDDLRKVVSLAFRQRRKMLRQSLKSLLKSSSTSGTTGENNDNLMGETVNKKKVDESSSSFISTVRISELSERWATKRPEQLRPVDFIHLTAELYGSNTKATTNNEELYYSNDMNSNNMNSNNRGDVTCDNDKRVINTIKEGGGGAKPIPSDNDYHTDVDTDRQRRKVKEENGTLLGRLKQRKAQQQHHQQQQQSQSVSNAVAIDEQNVNDTAHGEDVMTVEGRIASDRSNKQTPAHDTMVAVMQHKDKHKYESQSVWRKALFDNNKNNKQ